ncbi:BUD13 homolog isoform X2 [Phaenicophaeus curvirostris]|uniref:BUD13 homolog isoform X2 n=1 Tax=Phaenicophaeus curvirostris TaxID=33595 RepID=UPI0037F09E70
MAAQGMSKAKYLQRYLSGAEAAQPRRRRKKKPAGSAGRGGMRIVDDDVSWYSVTATQEKEEEEDDGDMPVVAEFIDERPDVVKLMEAFRTNTKWKLLGDQNGDSQSSDVLAADHSTVRRQRHDTPDPSPPRREGNYSPYSLLPKRQRHDSPDLSPPRRQRHDTPELSPPRWKCHDSLDLLPPRRKCHDTPDLSPPKQKHRDLLDLSPPRRQRHDTPEPSPPRRQRHDTPEPSPPRRQRHDTPEPSPPRRQRHDTPEPSPPRRQRHDTPEPSPPRRQRHDTPDLSPPRWRRCDSPDASSALGKKICKAPEKSQSWGAQGEQSRLRPGVSAKSSSRLKRQATPDLSPPRKKRYNSDSDSSPPWRKRAGSPSLKKQSRTKGGSQNTSDADLSPPRNREARGSPKKANVMFSGVKAGLVSADVLRREQQELRRNERNTKHLEEESRHAETVYRDKSGRKRDLMQEWLEQRQKAEAESKRDAQYAKWGKGLVQDRQQQQNVEDAIKEMQKPLARYIDDEDLDRMLREQEREGDPMADLIKKRKAKENKEKEKPRYKGPAPPLNRFNIWPGHRWDGVDRSNGFEQQRFARLANKKAVQELAYKWSVEDM